MKTIKLLFSFIFVISFTSCNDFLDTKATNILAPNNYYTTENQMNMAISGVYDILGKSNLYAYGLMTRIASEADEGFFSSTSRTLGPQFYNQTASDGDVLTLWTQLYDGITRANVVLENIDKPDMDETKRLTIKGEALFLRAFYYYWLVTNWGDVPLITKLPTDIVDNSVTRTSASKIYELITYDMIEAEALVPTATQVGIGGKINKSAVRGILARVYLNWAGYPLNNTAKYKDASDWAKKVIDDTESDHSLNPSYSQVFVNLAQDKYDIKECIWEVEFSTSGIGVAELGQIGSWIGVTTNDPKIGTSYGFISTTPRLFDSYSPGDLRRDRAIANYYYLNQNILTYFAPSIVYGKKVAKWRRAEEIAFPKVSQFTPINFPILRYSDILLMYAEAQNELNAAPTQGAINAVNLVRRRAWATGVKSITITNGGTGYTSVPTVVISGGGGSGANAKATINNGKITSITFLKDSIMGLSMGNGYTSPPIITFTGGGGIGAEATAVIYSKDESIIPTMSKEEFKLFLQDERSRELCFEGLRKYDLMRWNILVPRLKQIANDISSNAPANFKYAALSFNNVNENKFFLPIPSSEITANHLLIQNIGY